MYIGPAAYPARASDCVWSTTLASETCGHQVCGVGDPRTAARRFATEEDVGKDKDGIPRPFPRWSAGRNLGAQANAGRCVTVITGNTEKISRFA